MAVRSVINERFNPRSLAGATRDSTSFSFRCCYFNPRSLAGATPNCTALCSDQAFQSTLPRGSDALRQYVVRLVNQFQSTLPRGSDLLIIFLLSFSGISIHAPSRERLVNHFFIVFFWYFNPRSLTGATSKCSSSK